MTDLLGLNSFSGLTEGYAASQGSTLDTGDLRRRYAFGDKFSELKIMQDPYFRYLSLFRKVPVDDSQFKFAEKRPSWHKRYGYITAHGTSSSVSTTGDATLTAGNVEAGDTYYWKISTEPTPMDQWTKVDVTVSNKNVDQEGRFQLTEYIYSEPAAKK